MRVKRSSVRILVQIWWRAMLEGGNRDSYLGVSGDNRVSNAVQNVDSLGVSSDVDRLGTGGERYWREASL